MTAQPMGWTAVDVPTHQPVGLDVHATRIGSRLHVLFGSGIGDEVSHLVVSAQGRCERREPLPLASVSSVGGGPGGLVVAGARAGDGAAVVQQAQQPAMQLADSVAAWPLLISGDPVRVAWATGSAPSTVWLAEFGRTQAQSEVLRVDAVYALQGSAWREEVDLLCDTSAGARLVRVSAERTLELVAPREAVLVPGALLTGGDGEITRFAVDTLEGESVPLPSWPTGQRRRISKLLSRDGLLSWSTNRIDEPSDPEPLGWIARFDPDDAEVGRSFALPYPGRPAAIAMLDDGLFVVQRTDAGLQIWRRPADQLG